MAHVAQIAGDVKLQLSIKPDGSIASAEVVSGHPLLARAALDSAKRSKFECRGCIQPSNSYTLPYTFEIAPGNPDPCCCTLGHQPTQTTENYPQVLETLDHITIRVGPLCMCPDSCSRRGAGRYRSAKCLYLWKCGVRRVM